MERRIGTPDDHRKKVSLKLGGVFAALFVLIGSLLPSPLLAELIGDRVSVRCENSDGLAGETELTLARFNDNKKLYASIGDGLWVESIGSSIMRQILGVENKASVHVYLLAELKKSKKKKKKARAKRQLFLTQVGMFSSFEELKIAAATHKTKLKLNPGRTFDHELVVPRTAPDTFECSFVVLD